MGEARMVRIMVDAASPTMLTMHNEPVGTEAVAAC